MRRAAVALGNLLFRFRNALFPLLLLGFVAVDRPRLAFGSWSGKNALDAGAVILLLLGEALRVLTIGLAYVRRGGRDRRVDADRLVVEGVFAHVRNPLYLGNFLGLVGLALVFNGRLVLFLGLPLLALGYLCIVLAEEEFLRRKFGGEFERYCSEVNRFWPDFSGLRSTRRAFTFEWRRVVRKEYGTAFSGATLLLGLLVWTRWVLAGREVGLAWAKAILPIWLLLVAGYLLARFVKKSGRLGSGGGESPAPQAQED